VAKQTVDAQVGDLAAPSAAASAAPIAGPPPANLAVQEVAKGIWHLAGQSHHSVLVEFSDHLTLIENAAERYSSARRYCKGTRAAAEQATDACRQQSPPL